MFCHLDRLQHKVILTGYPVYTIPPWILKSGLFFCIFLRCDLSGKGLFVFGSGSFAFYSWINIITFWLGGLCSKNRCSLDFWWFQKQVICCPLVEISLVIVSLKLCSIPQYWCFACQIRPVESETLWITLFQKIALFVSACLSICILLIQSCSIFEILEIPWNMNNERTVC